MQRKRASDAPLQAIVESYEEVFKGTIVGVNYIAVPEEVTVERLLEMFAAVSRIRANSSWWLGDLWVTLELRYGDHKAITENPNWTGPAYQTLANAAWVCKAFEFSRRRENLSFALHAEVAALPQDEQDRLLDRAEAEKWTRETMRQHVRALQTEADIAAAASVCEADWPR
jgi:hypothetical protein